MWLIGSASPDTAEGTLCDVTRHGKPSIIVGIVTGDIKANQVLLNRVPEQATEDSVKYQIYY